MFSYAICNGCVVAKSISQIFSLNQNFIDHVDTCYNWAYMYIQPCVVIGLLERLAATIFVEKYERSNVWSVYILLQCLGIFIVWYESTLELTSAIKFIQLSLSLFICLCLIALYFVNRRLTLASRHKSQLTVRYQLTENVKALRIFVPFVVIDNCLSLMFVFSMQFFYVDFNFDLETCETIDSYKFSFAIFRVILVITQYSMPIIVIKQHSRIVSQVKIGLRRISADPKNSEQFGNAETPPIFQLNNALGMDITGRNQDHFEQLRSHWLENR